ncbi:hypothetical protein CEXT_488321 [Caerostris extrusa]|uniref:Uncharacterized protein n=1 Tax=Caerostris extrusa TaxID=172846 RepID=A0AAV4XF76_CAEEX|nr:hypothetical protein CEXT_488321 [Caerostris extrusa]
MVHDILQKGVNTKLYLLLHNFVFSKGLELFKLLNLSTFYNGNCIPANLIWSPQSGKNISRHDIQRLCLDASTSPNSLTNFHKFIGEAFKKLDLIFPYSADMENIQLVPHMTSKDLPNLHP